MPKLQPRVRIIHETNPQKYFPALYELAGQGRINITGAHRYSVAKEWARSWLRERKPLKTRTGLSLRDLLFRIQIPRVRGEVIVIAFAPWDWRMLIYGYLARHNSVIYHTSWPYWDSDSVPRRYGPLSFILRRYWLHILRKDNVKVVSVLSTTQTELINKYGISSHVIPHAVPEAFFKCSNLSRREDCSPPVRLLYVGELATKKGIENLIQLFNNVNGGFVHLTIVGDGPLRERCIEFANSNSAVDYVGAIQDRDRLAELMAAQDVLVLLSQRTPPWEELFGIVIAEAMAAGLGIITTDHIGPRSLLEKARIGNIFQDDDIDGPVKLVSLLSSDPAKLSHFREAHAHLAAEFSIGKVAHQWDSIIQSAKFGNTSIRKD